MNNTKFNRFKHYAILIRQSVKPIKCPSDFWKLSNQDFKTFLLNFAPTTLIFTILFIKNSYLSVLKYRDGPDFLFNSITSYSKPKVNPWKRFIGIERNHLIYYLPLYPMFIRICSFFTFGNYIIGPFLGIILSNFLLTYSFRRLLLVYDLSDDSNWITFLISMIPYRFIISRSTISNEPLFLSITILTVIFFKINYKNTTILLLWLACSTKYEGIHLTLSIMISYLIRHDIKNAIYSLSIILPYFFIYWLMEISSSSDTNGYNDYIKYQTKFETKFYNNRIFYMIYTMIAYVLSFNGSLMLSKTIFPLSIFSILILFVPIPITTCDIGLYLMQALIFSVNIGFGKFLSNNNFRKIILFLYFPYLFIIAWFSVRQIESNICSDTVFNSILSEQNYNY